MYIPRAGRQNNVFSEISVRNCLDFDAFSVANSTNFDSTAAPVDAVRSPDARDWVHGRSHSARRRRQPRRRRDRGQAFPFSLPAGQSRDRGCRARRRSRTARKEHWNARHHCSAFVLGPSRRSRPRCVARTTTVNHRAPLAGRCSRRSTGRDFVDCVAVVCRYFGGTLLGAGGLVRAYSEAVLTTIDEAHAQGSVVARERRELFTLALSHSDAGPDRGRAAPARRAHSGHRLRARCRAADCRRRCRRDWRPSSPE